jgi:hypothetical protein
MNPSVLIINDTCDDRLVMMQVFLEYLTSGYVNVEASSPDNCTISKPAKAEMQKNGLDHDDLQHLTMSEVKFADYSHIITLTKQAAELLPDLSDNVQHFQVEISQLPEEKQDKKHLKKLRKQIVKICNEFIEETLEIGDEAESKKSKSRSKKKSSALKKG